MKGEKISHEEKAFSIHEEHTRRAYVSTAGRPVEREVAMAVEESAQQVVLGWPCLWSEQDVEVTTELWEALRAD